MLELLPSTQQHAPVKLGLSYMLALLLFGDENSMVAIARKGDGESRMVTNKDMKEL
jgi:hypothetical protein